ncbi:hypothetical protein [Streptomyces canus]|uniref:hypothetical protein n=1 Tax=Streptomyces canus TaxID=58343 RepID=UPI0037D9BF8F
MSAQAVGTAPEPTHDLALAAAAHRAGVSRVVKLSWTAGRATTRSPAGSGRRRRR